ncbi:MAG TPA: hypothetical protein VKU89_08565 [Solirubrobacteraceae bacterium]|nr:hypothetical protein [Solirubrobacteraceae bacterium]
MATLVAMAALFALPATSQAALKIYKNNRLVEAGAQVPNVGYGQIELESTAPLLTTIECVNVGFGYSENPTSGTNPKGQILVWWASGHDPTTEHPELSAKCRYVEKGETKENVLAWATAEPELVESLQEALICINPSETLAECRAKEHATEERKVITKVSRENLTLPWNAELVEEGTGNYHVKIGIPSEEGKSCEAAHLSTSEHVPPGCIRVQIIVPQLGLDLPFEGHNNPKAVNGLANGLSPSTWEFEGARSEEPALYYKKNREVKGYTYGSVKILGFEGQELITVH